MNKAILGVLMMFLMGCRTVHYYDFKQAEVEVGVGTVEIAMIGRFGENYEKNGREFLYWGFPYYLQFTYSAQKNGTLDSLEVKNIEIYGEDSEVSYSLQDIRSDSVRVYDERQIVRASVGPLSSEDYRYENYMVAAVVVVHENGVAIEKSIEARLETNFRTERRSDRFDQGMSI